MGRKATVPAESLDVRSRARLTALLAVTAVTSTMASTVAAPPLTGGSIVVLREGVAPLSLLGRLGLAVEPRQTYTSIFNGFAADLDAADRRRMAADADVVEVLDDGRVRGGTGTGRLVPLAAPAQITDNALRRVGALQSPTARIDGHDERVNADVAVLDTGIEVAHPDLNVVGGVDCTGGNSFDDVEGHGTFVAGLAAALDNAIGVVGVAPGARLWAVRISGPDNTASDAALLCGLDWVAGHAGVIDVANLSMGGPGIGGGCRNTVATGALALEHRAICRIVDAGVVVVASAGNDGADAGAVNPAAYPEVLTVSAFADSDGVDGGHGAPLTCRPGHPEIDDSFASFSNFGVAVDVTAPGGCVTSTALGGRYAIASGTSASAPW
jgi:subtilisin